jgi:acetolactate synthase-1/2/3 large subunit
VVIDIPKDVQQAVFEPFFPDEVPELEGYKLDQPKATDEELIEVLNLISKAKKPVLYTGGGIISADAHKELKEFAELTGLPVTHTLMGLGVFDPDHPQSCYWYGMHGTVAGNWAVCESDLLICAGARFDDRITGKVDKYAQEAYVIHFDLDKSEHNKNVHAHFPIRSDIKYALKRMSELIKERKLGKPDLKSWMDTITGWKEKYPFKYEKGKHISSQEAVEALYEVSKGEAIITTGVGQHQMWAAQYYRYKEPRTYISSLGLGTMGFGYPAAVGAKVARPDKEVIDIDGDGSFLMNVQELATAKIEKINAKCLLLNNQHLGMVVQWEDRFYESVRGHTILCDPENIGGPENEDGIYPDYIKMCEGFGVKARRIIKREDLHDGIQEMLDADEPFLLEIIVPHTEHVLPMIPQGKSAKEMLID